MKHTRFASSCRVGIPDSKAQGLCQAQEVPERQLMAVLKVKALGRTKCQAMESKMLKVASWPMVETWPGHLGFTGFTGW